MFLKPDWPIRKEHVFFPLVYTLLASFMSRVTEYIAIEDDNVISHYLQVFIGNLDGRLQWMPSLVILMDEYLVNKQIAFKCLGDHCKLSRFVLGNDWWDYFLPGPFMHPHLQHIQLWFQHKADSDGACPAWPISPLISTQGWQLWSMSCMSYFTQPDNYPNIQ